MIVDNQSKIQLLTGLLVVLGFLLVFFALWNIEKIEKYMVKAMSGTGAEGSDDLWSGTDAPIYDEMFQDLVDNSTPQNLRKASLDNPQAERSYNGRYLVIRPGELTTNRIIGEANLRRLGDRVLFVYLSQRGDVEARGYAYFESAEDSDVLNVTARQTAEVRVDGVSHVAMGVSTPIVVGGHTFFAMRDGDGEPYEALAYRVHGNL